MKTLREILVEADELVVDSGAEGKGFESSFKKGARMLGLEFEENAASGSAWDIKPKGDGWNSLVADKDVNLKTSGTKWMFSSAELYKRLPWDELPPDYDREKAARVVRSVLSKIGVTSTVFLKPKSAEVQSAIVKAVASGDVDGLRKLFVSKNFAQRRLTSYSVRVLDDGKRVTSVAIDMDGKVFMRSEKPRALGGTTTVTFRTPTATLNKRRNSVARP